MSMSKVQDSIVLTGIEFLASHGATEEERVRKQRFSVDLKLSLDLSEPASTDSLKDTADYQTLGETVIEIGTRGRHHLLETLAQEIIDKILEEKPTAQITVTVRKLQPPVPFSVRSIEVTLTRGPLQGSGN